MEGNVNDVMYSKHVGRFSHVMKREYLIYDTDGHRTIKRLPEKEPTNILQALSPRPGFSP